MPSYSSFGSGRANAGEDDLLILPPRYSPNGTKRGLLHFHGAGEGVFNAARNSSLAGHYNLVNRYVTSGFPVLCGDCGGAATWGNSTAIGKVAGLKTYAQGALGAKSGTVILSGVSMGGLLALNWARANVSSVAGIILVIPVLDLNGVYAGNVGGVAAAIATAYGGTYVAGTQQAAHDPATYAATGDLGSIPILLFYAGSDPFTAESVSTTFSGHVGSSCTAVRLGSDGHTETSVSEVNLTTVAAFLAGLA